MCQVRRDMIWVKKQRKHSHKFFQGRYGIDELGKILISLSIVLQALGIVLKSSSVFILSLIVLLISLYRMLSRQHLDRGEENRIHMGYVRLWKLRYAYRKEARIYMCKRCGRYIRVPKGKGKILVTCKACGSKSIRHT